MKIQLKCEEEYISKRARVVRDEIQDSIDKVNIIKSTDYSRFINNVFKSQKQFVERKVLEEDDSKFLRNLNSRFEKLTKGYILHKDIDQSRVRSLVDGFKGIVRENIKDDSKECDKRLDNIFDWFENNLSFGFDKRTVKERISTECLKGIYDNCEAVQDFKEFLVKSNRP